MNRPVLLASVMVLLAIHPGATEATGNPVGFDVHDGYFVSNKFEPDAPLSCVVINDQESFDKVFGVAMVMRDKAHRLPAAAFPAKSVVAVIHRGKAMVTYQVEGVVAEDRILIVRYTTKSEPSESAEFACPLILSLDKGDFTAIRIIEGGKEIKRLDLAPRPVLHIAANPPAALTEKSSAGKTTLVIKGAGIGQATVRLVAGSWPAELHVRAELRGLESLTIANGRIEWSASVLSHSGHQTLLQTRKDGKQGPPLKNDDAYWTEILRCGPDGKPVDGLPPADGYFDVPVPGELLTKTSELKLNWIDFHR